MEQTLILVKPDGVKRKLAGQVISRIEAKNFDIREMKMMTMSRELAEEHYAEHKGKKFFEALVTFITSGPVVAMRVEGEGVVAMMRKIMGDTAPANALPGTIRGDFALTIDENIVHGSDTEPGSAERELKLFFG